MTGEQGNALARLLPAEAPKLPELAPAPEVVAFVPRKKLIIDWSLVITLCAASAGLLLLLASVLTFMGRFSGLGPLALRPTHGVDLFAFAFLVGVGPFAYFRWRAATRRFALDARIPDFLIDVASLHKAGLTLPDSIQTAAKSNYGPLSVEVNAAAEQLKWDIPVLTVLENFRKNIGTSLADRTLTVVIEAGKTGGNVPEVLEIAANNARAHVVMRETRHRTMQLYTIITYVASLVFLGVALALQGIFVPRMIEAFSALGGGGALGFAKLPSADAFRSLFYVAALVQAIGNGMVGGVMQDGKLITGLRHAWSMTIFTVAGFLLTG